jgi:hypothetical protein
MADTSLVQGRHIWIHRLDAFGFDDVVEMLLEHMDSPEHAGKVIILGAYIHWPVSHFRQLYPGRKVVIYQLEQMVGSVTWHPVPRIVEHLRGADEIWDLDPLNATFLSWCGVEVDQVLPMRYTRALERIALQPEPGIDVLFYGYLNERRFRIVRELEQQLYNRIKLVWLYGVTGPELDQYIAGSRIVLNLHAFEPWNRQEQVRIFYPLINGRLVVSEVSEYNAFGDAIVEVEPEQLADTLLHWLDEDRWRCGGLAARDAFRQAG